MAESKQRLHFIPPGIYAFRIIGQHIIKIENIRNPIIRKIAAVDLECVEPGPEYGHLAEYRIVTPFRAVRLAELCGIAEVRPYDTPERLVRKCMGLVCHLEIRGSQVARDPEDVRINGQ